MNRDRVCIEGLTILTTIGVYDWEKSIKQKLVLDIEIAWNNQPAGMSDNVEDCLDYAKVSQSVIDFVENNQFNLIEHVAECVAEMILQDYSVPWIRIKVSKPTAVVAARNVAIIIVRSNV